MKRGMGRQPHTSYTVATWRRSAAGRTYSEIIAWVQLAGLVDVAHEHVDPRHQPAHTNSHTRALKAAFFVFIETMF